MPASKTTKIVVASVGGVCLILAAVLPTLIQKYRQPETLLPYTGRVVDERNDRPIHNANVSIEIGSDVPQNQDTDSDGVFHVTLPASAQSVRIRVLANNYKAFDRNVTVSRTGLEPVRLTPEASASSGRSSSTMEFVTVVLPHPMKLRSAIQFIADQDGFAVEFAVECDNTLNGELPATTLKGNTFADVIDGLRYRVSGPRTPNYRVTRIEAKGKYEIKCGG